MCFFVTLETHAYFGHAHATPTHEVSTQTSMPTGKPVRAMLSGMCGKWRVCHDAESESTWGRDGVHDLQWLPKSAAALFSQSLTPPITNLELVLQTSMHQGNSYEHGSREYGQVAARRNPSQ